MQQEEEIKLINSVGSVNLCTVDKDGFPSVRPMANLRDANSNAASLAYIQNENKNAYATYLTTYKSSQKVKEITANNKCSLFYIDMKTGGAVTTYGTIEVVEDEALKNGLWNDAWKRSYPEGKTDPNYSLLKFTPVKVRSSLNGKSNEHQA